MACVLRLVAFLLSATSADAAPIAIGAVFQEQSNSSQITYHGTFSETADFYRIGNWAYIVWTKGPRKGQVVQAVEMPGSKTLASAPNPKDLIQRVDSAIAEITRSDDKQATKLKADLLEDLRHAVNGDNSHLGLRISRLFDPDSNTLYRSMETAGK